MLCMSFNVKKFKLIILAILVCAVVLAITPSFSKSKENEKIILENDTERINFLNSIGYKAEENSCVKSEVTIPCEFNEVYNRYNNIQIQQGFDLSDFKGKPADIYTYTINENPEMNVNLIIYENMLIGCDVHSSVYGSSCEAIIK